MTDEENIKSTMDVSSSDYLELDTSVSHLVKHHAEVTEIVAAWKEIYGELGSHPRVACCTSVCINVLACFATHYEHEDLLHEIIPLCSPFCKFSPHLTAIYDYNENMLDVIYSASPSYCIDIETGINDDVHDWDIGYRLGPVCLTTKGYGYITDDQLSVGGKVTSVIDILLQRDDKEMLAFLMEYFTGKPDTLVGLARHYKSKHCLEHIQGIMHADDHVHNNSHEHYTNSLIDLFYFVSSFHGTISHLHIESAIHQWHAFSRYRIGKTARSFMSTSEQHTLACLTDGGKIKHNLILELSSSDDHNLHQMYHNVTLENCAVLVKHIEESVRYSSSGILPIRILAENIYNIYHILACFPFTSSDELLGCSRSLKLHNAITKIILQTGVQAPVSTKCSDSECLCSDRFQKSDSECLCSDRFQKDSITKFFDIMRCIHIRLKDSPSSLDEKVLRHAHDHLMILLAYGYTSTQDDRPFSLMNFRCPQFLLKGAKITVSMLSQKLYNEFAESLLFFRRSRDKYLTQEEGRVPLGIEHCIATANFFGICYGRSLKELCRVKLYQIVPKSTMPQYVEKLELSEEQKDYLSLGIHPL